MLSLPQIEALIRQFAGKKRVKNKVIALVKDTVIRDIARVLHEKQLMFKHGEKEIRLFIGQAAHETGGFTSFREKYNGDPETYFENMYGKKKKLGNTEDGDGYRFYGRGMLHITGRYNYKLYAQKIGKEVEIMANPKLLEEDVEIAARTSVAYWLDRVQPQLLALSVSEEEKLFIKSTEGVNYNELHTEQIKIDESMSETKKAKLRKMIEDYEARIVNRRKRVMAALRFDIPLQSSRETLPETPRALPETHDKKQQLLYDMFMSFIREEVYLRLHDLLFGKPQKRSETPRKRRSR